MLIVSTTCAILRILLREREKKRERERERSNRDRDPFFPPPIHTNSPPLLLGAAKETALHLHLREIHKL
jgi:hypothetical protein